MGNPTSADAGNDADAALSAGTADAPPFVPVALDPDVHEYAAGDAVGMANEPGLPDELVAELIEEPAPFFELNTELPAEFAPFAGALLFAIVITETIKGMGLRDFLHKSGRDNHARTTWYRWLLFIVAAVTSQTFGFRRMMLDLMGLNLSYVESIVYGACSVTIAAGFVYNLKLSRILKARIYRLLDVSDDDVKTKQGNAAVTPEQIEADRKARGLDDD